MATIAANVAVIHDGKVLLTRRDDFGVWCLPGGMVEEAESVAEAAIRETKEETGLDVTLTRLVGVYSRLGGLPDIHAVLYTAQPIGGELRLQPGETTEVAFFDPAHLPEPIMSPHRKRIQDAMSDVEGMSVRQQLRFAGKQAFTRQELMEWMQQSDLSPQEFYRQTFEAEQMEEIVEVNGV